MVFLCLWQIWKEFWKTELHAYQQSHNRRALVWYSWFLHANFSRICIFFFAPHQVYQFYTELINSNAIRLTRKSRTRRPNEFHLGALGPTKKNMRHYHCRYLLCTSIKFNAITILFCTIFYNEVFSLGEVVPLYLSVIQFNLCFLQQMFAVTFVLNWLHYKHLCWFFWLVFFSPTENYAH